MLYLIIKDVEIVKNIKNKSVILKLFLFLRSLHGFPWLKNDSLVCSI